MSKGIEKSGFGRLPSGTEIDLYTLTNANGLSCKIITYGGTITELRAPDRHGNFGNIVLGYDRLEGVLADTAYKGAIVGRVANRIAGASFKLNGKTYKLAANNGPNHLHGGLRGFDKQVWTAEPETVEKNVGLILRHTSPDGDEGYPGNLTVMALFVLTDANELCLSYLAETDKPTPVNLTSHPYWNLAGQGDILGHELVVAADDYTPMDRNQIPTGEIKTLEGTPYDFAKPALIGSRFSDLPGEPKGYDTNYILNKTEEAVAFAARAIDAGSGRVLELWTDQPGMQFYTGTYLDKPWTGFCLEPQIYPDAIHHSNFPDCVLNPGQTYNHHTICRFSAA